VTAEAVRPSWPWLLFRAPLCPGRITASSRGIRHGMRSRADRRIAPPSTSSRASTPMRCRHRTGPELPARAAFRPRGFAPPRRVPPLWSRGLVASRCRSWGSPRFVCIGRHPCGCRCGTAGTFLDGAFIPPEGSPSPAAAPCHHGPCLLAVRPLRDPRFPPVPLPEPELYAQREGAVDFEALLHLRVRDVVPPLPATRRPILPWASFPSKVPFQPGSSRTILPPGRAHRVSPRRARPKLRITHPDQGCWPGPDREDRGARRPPRWSLPGDPAASSETVHAHRPKPITRLESGISRKRDERARFGRRSLRGSPDTHTTACRLVPKNQGTRAGKPARAQRRRSLSGAEVRDI
jgi:hypothetical protein